ncbi:MAG: FdhF/YdeP family oxidoreductase [Oligoflexus sp.]
MRKNFRDVVACPVNDELYQTMRAIKPPDKAGGWPAVLSSQRFLHRDLGLLQGNKALLSMNQKDGFDCPGCAWPDPEKHRSFAEFCENGAKALGEEATSRMIDRQFFQKHRVEDLSRWSDFDLSQAGRIAEPLYLRKDSSHYQAISWDAAFRLIASQLKQVDHADEAIFYTSGRTSNEAAYLYQLFVRAYGTNNLPDCSNLCHESSGRALQESIGIGKGTVRLEDFDQADLIMVIGQNPGTNHPRMLSSLRQAVKNGARIISINPLFESGLKAFQHPQKLPDMLGAKTTLAAKNYAIRINGDQAFFLGLGKAIIARYPEGLDPQFIQQKSFGFAAYKEKLRALSWDDIEAEAGLKQAEIVELAEQICQTKALISCWAMGLTQQPQAVATIRELTNLHLIGGFIGKPGSGLCPVRGHSNVQGDRTMGIYEKPSPDFIERLSQVYGQDFPKKHGFDVVDAIRAMLEDRVRVLICMGGNFLSASPDTELTAEAMKHLDLSVQVSTKLNRSHLITGAEALILPCLARSEIDIQRSGEQFVTVENSMGFVHRSAGKRKPRSVMWQSEVAIICEMAQHSLQKSAIPWQEFRENYDRIRDDIARVIPGFDNFNQRLQENHGFYLPNSPHDEQSFTTADGLAHFSQEKLVPMRIAPGRYILMTIRSHDQYNTTIYGLDDRYRGIYGGRRVLFMNPEDMQREGFLRHQAIDICSYFAEKTRIGRNFRVIPFDIPKGCLASYFPEANVLVPLESFAKDSQTPTSKFIEVSLLGAG